MIREVILFFLLIAMGISAKGVPAYPNKVKVRIENGDTVEILVKGDECFKYAVSSDGYVLTPKNNSWYYLKKNKDTDFIVSDISIKKSVTKNFRDIFVRVDTNFELPSLKKTLPRHKRQAVYGGVSHALVVLIEYPDKKFTKSKQEISDLFNQIGYHEDKAQGSVRDFYNYASYGTFDLISDIYGPYTTKSSMDFYGENLSSGNDRNVLELVVEAIQNLPEDIDLSVYDNNNDGIVDNIHIIFAGYGEESGAPSSTIWSHEYPQMLPITKNGYEFAGYSCTPELRSNMGKGISRIGVICHELGHAFGANDYYDVDYSNNGSYEGTGVWDLMASGSWNNNGISPANFNPYVKIEDFGWINPIIPEGSGSLEISSYNFNPEVYQILTSNPDDYYLIEYRNAQSFDIGLPGEGLLIYHVHPSISNKRKSNTINSKHPQCFYPVCASSNDSPFESYNYGDINSAGCPFPGSTSNTEFSASSSPKAFLWNGNSTDFSIKNIKLCDKKAQFDLLFESQIPSQLPTESLVFQENFENGMDMFFQESLEGTAEWSIYPTNSLSANNDLPKPIEGKRALMLSDGTKALRPSKSLLYSKGITLNPDSSYVMSYWLRTQEHRTEGYHHLYLSIRNSTSNKWDSFYETSDPTREWTEIRIELPTQLTDLHFQFSGEVLDSSILIDDIRIKSIGFASTVQLDADVESISITNNPLCIEAHNHVKVYIYDISGKKIDSFFMLPSSIVMPKLPKGIYLICTDMGSMHKVVI